MVLMPEMIQITLHAEGRLADILGSEPIEYGLATPAHVCNLTELVYLRYPDLAAWAGRIRIMVNDETAGSERRLAGGDVVRLIPQT